MPICSVSSSSLCLYGHALPQRAHPSHMPTQGNDQQEGPSQRLAPGQDRLKERKGEIWAKFIGCFSNQREGLHRPTVNSARTLAFRLRSPPQCLRPPAPFCLGEKPFSKRSIWSLLSCLVQVQGSDLQTNPHRATVSSTAHHSYQGQTSPSESAGTVFFSTSTCLIILRISRPTAGPRSLRPEAKPRPRGRQALGSLEHPPRQEASTTWPGTPTQHDGDLIQARSFAN